MQLLQIKKQLSCRLQRLFTRFGMLSMGRFEAGKLWVEEGGHLTGFWQLFRRCMLSGSSQLKWVEGL